MNDQRAFAPTTVSRDLSLSQRNFGNMVDTYNIYDVKNLNLNTNVFSECKNQFSVISEAIEKKNLKIDMNAIEKVWSKRV